MGTAMGTAVFSNSRLPVAAAIMVAVWCGFILGGPIIGPVASGANEPGGASAAEPDFSPLVQQSVRVRGGVVRGRVTTVDGKALGSGVAIRLIGLHDQKIFRAESTNDGRFRISGVRPAVYTLVATSADDQYASYLLHVVSDRDGSSVGKTFASAIVVSLAPVGRTEVRQFATLHVPVHASGAPGGSHPIYTAGPSVNETAGRGPTVCLGADGQLSGRLMVPAAGDKPRLPAAGMVVRIMRSDQTIAETSTDKAGRFQFHGVTAGHYAFIAAGSCGFTAFGLEVRPGAPGQPPQPAQRSYAGWSGLAADRSNRGAAEIHCEVVPLYRSVGSDDIAGEPTSYPRLGPLRMAIASAVGLAAG
jgi:hypothetical protein